MYGNWEEGIRDLNTYFQSLHIHIQIELTEYVLDGGDAVQRCIQDLSLEGAGLTFIRNCIHNSFVIVTAR